MSSNLNQFNKIKKAHKTIEPSMDNQNTDTQSIRLFIIFIHYF